MMSDETLFFDNGATGATTPPFLADPLFSNYNSNTSNRSAVVQASCDSPPSGSLAHPNDLVKRCAVSNFKRPTSKSFFEVDHARKAQSTMLFKPSPFMNHTTTTTKTTNNNNNKTNTTSTSNGSINNDKTAIPTTTMTKTTTTTTTNTIDPNNPPLPAPRIGNVKREKYSSTETMFIRNCLLAPDTDEIVYCMARAVLLKLRENDNLEKKLYLSIFDERHRKLFEPYYNVTPNFEEVHTFLIQLFSARNISAECGVMAVVYVDRLFVETGVTFDKTNWRPIVFTAVLLANKTWEDANVWNSDYVGIFEGLEVEAINMLEREFLCRISFNLALQPSVYTHYYFELRSLAAISAETFPVKPLDKKVASLMEAKTMGGQEKVKMSVIHSNRCLSFKGYEPGKAPLSSQDFGRFFKNGGFSAEKFMT